MGIEQCYMCDCASTSMEHAPPRCIFPEAKDVAGNYRRNLVTVPSCDVHNSLKSADDEFLLVSLAGMIGNNSIGYRQKFTKVNRALKRTSLKLLEKTLKNPWLDWLEIGPNDFIDVIWGTPDFERLNICFDRIARALYFDTFREKFLGRTRVFLGYIQIPDGNPKEFQRMIHDKVRQELEKKPLLGSNPDVFQYQFTDEDQFGRVAFLRFYGGMEICVGLIPADVERPKDFVDMMIDLGITTIVRTSTGNYTFNANQRESGLFGQ